MTEGAEERERRANELELLGARCAWQQRRRTQRQQGLISHSTSAAAAAVSAAAAAAAATATATSSASASASAATAADRRHSVLSDGGGANAAAQAFLP